MLDQMMRMLEGQQIGSYRLNKFLGAGGFGGVFHASEMVRNTSVQEVAIKVIPESSDDKLIELKNARKLEHSNLIKAYSVGEFHFLNTEMLYLVMELAQGSLENHIQKGGLSSSEIKNITTQVAQGLNYLHGQKKVHRDLKPGNILKVNQQYKLADFGLIRTLNNKSHTQTVNNSGTIIYMPPEAFRGDISSAWDMWSLGIMLIKMTTNQFPYKFNNDINQLMARVMNCDLQIPSLPMEFKPIIEGCLQKDRRQRWTAQQVLDALQPVEWTSPPSPPPAPAAVKKPVSPIPLIASPTPFTEKLPKGITLEMVSLPAGEFLMGSPDSDPNAQSREKPPHQVQVNSFAIGKYPVTQAQYQAVMGTNPSHFKNNPQNPVERVSCNDAKAFCQKLSQITGKTYRLPTEAEWEYACRAGTTTRYYFGDDANQLGDYAWYKGNSRYKTHPVGEKKPNAWGLYDMSGNVWEWCEDNWHDNYIGAPKDGSAWLTNDNDYKIVRGGSWFNNPDFCRSAYRLNLLRRDYDDSSDGFRVVCGAGRESIATVTSTPLPKESPTPLTNFTEKLPKAVTLEMVSLPAGRFLMGSADSDPNAQSREKPPHQVKVNSFAIGKYPVTQAQYEAVMGKNPSKFQNNPQNPVESVSWNDAQAFCKKLSQITGKTYRLPTEAEWEYACRAGTTTRHYFGDDANQLGDYAWHNRNSQDKTHPVGQKKPNAWGLYDMSGNVWEWCEDNWHDSYENAPRDGSAWLIKDSHSQIVRGGSWYDYPGYCRSASRHDGDRRVIGGNYGFRVVCGAGGKSIATVTSTPLPKESPTPLTEFTEKLPKGITLEMVSLPAGEFIMGSPDSDPDAHSSEKPPHQVKVNSFAIGKYPVTQAQYQAVMGTNPSYFPNNPQNPVESVSWIDAQAFCKKLSQITGKTYRLPTEAEWEYACRAGTTTRFYFGDDANQLGDYAWYEGNSQSKTHPVGQKKPNAWGLYDMSGNVWEWCEDNWHNSYENAPRDGSAWLIKDNNDRILRGGSWFLNPYYCRSAYRRSSGRRVGINVNRGFRVVCSAGGKSIATVTSTPLPKESPTPLTEFTEKLPNRVTLEMVSLPAGQFLMGSPDYESEKPQHQVKVNSFAIGKYPVTQAQYEAVMGTNPSHFKNNPQNPVESVSWNDAQAFCKKLSQITGKTYRLPTEAEWEYACRAGTTTRYYFGDDANQLGDYAWYIGNSQQTTHPVGQKKPNAWGLYDMSGNVWEWCEDNWHDNYIGAPTDGSAWLINNDYRSHFKCPRGGSWFDFPGSCRSAFRFRSFRFINFSYRGFRVVCGAGRTL